MRKIVTAAATAAMIGCAASSPAFADCAYPNHNWVLLGIDVSMGAKFTRDMTKETGLGSDCPDGIPAFSTQKECEVALRRVIARYSRRSHAAGGDGLYTCSNVDAWTVGGGH